MTFGRALLLAVVALAAGIFLLLSGAGMAELHIIECGNHFALTAADANCRAPLYWWYGGWLCTTSGVVIAAAAIFFRLRRR